MHNFKELKVWKAGIEITKAIFILTRTFPSEEKFGLISQMTRSAVSIPSNIALGSSFELETQTIIAREFNYITIEKSENICAAIIEIQKMISGLQKSLNT